MKGPHIDITLTEEQNNELKARAKEKGMCKTDYARMKLFQTDIGALVPKEDALEGEEFISLREFADMVHISAPSVRKLCKEKKLTYYKIGKIIRIRKSEIEKFRHLEEYEEPYENSAYMDTMQASEYLAVTRNCIIKWIKTGVLSASLIGKRYRVAKEELDNLVLEHKIVTSDL